MKEVGITITANDNEGIMFRIGNGDMYHVPLAYAATIDDAGNVVLRDITGRALRYIPAFYNAMVWAEGSK